MSVRPVETLLLYYLGRRGINQAYNPSSAISYQTHRTSVETLCAYTDMCLIIRNANILAFCYLFSVYFGKLTWKLRVLGLIIVGTQGERVTVFFYLLW